MGIEYNECHYDGMYNVYMQRRIFFFITEFVHMNAGVSSEKEKVKESQSQSRRVAPSLDTHFGCRVGGVTKCDNTSSISISKNPVQHSRTKHIEIRHHFLRDHAQKGDITLDFVGTEDQLADVFTKPLNENQFVNIRRQLGVISL